MTRVVLFDVMSTLVHDPFREEMPAFFGMSLERMMAEKHPTAWIEFELGRLDEPAFLGRFFADGRSFDHEGFVETVASAYRFLPGIEGLLSELAERGTAMHVLSNYPIWYRRIEERIALSRYLPWTFVSTDVGMRKPDPGIFEHVARSLGVRTADCLLVDDQRRNVVAAREVGMEAIEFVDAESLRVELERRGHLEGSSGPGQRRLPAPGSR